MARAPSPCIVLPGILMLEKGLYSDCTVVCDERVYALHQDILRSNSRLFGDLIDAALECAHGQARIAQQ